MGALTAFPCSLQPKVTSLSSACATLTLGLGCVLNLVNLSTAWFIYVKPEELLAVFKGLEPG